MTFTRTRGKKSKNWRQRLRTSTRRCRRKKKRTIHWSCHISKRCSITSTSTGRPSSRQKRTVQRSWVTKTSITARRSTRTARGSRIRRRTTSETTRQTLVRSSRRQRRTSRTWTRWSRRSSRTRRRSSHSTSRSRSPFRRSSNSG